MDAITIEWKGETLVIGEDEAFELGEQIEEIVTLGDLAEMANNKPQFHKLAKCYSAMINFAGGNTTPREVHSMMMEQIKGEGQVDMVASAITTLISILMDGAPDAEDGDTGKKGKSS